MINVLTHMSDIMIPMVIFWIVGYGMVSGVKVYETFLKGAKEGLRIVVEILPTLVGLILMLGNMSDVDALAKGMAVALITTLYGSLLANVVCLPMASKLKARHDEEFLCKQLVMEGVLAIQEGENPKFIEEKLYKLLPASYKKPADKGEKQDGNNDGKKNSKKKGIGKRRRWNKKEIEE